VDRLVKQRTDKMTEPEPEQEKKPDAPETHCATCTCSTAKPSYPESDGRLRE
jgi:hypothetical protein